MMTEAATADPQRGTPQVILYSDQPDRGERDFVVRTLVDRWPGELLEDVRSAAEVVLGDPISFPYEAMTARDWQVPLTIVLPDSIPADTLLNLLGPPLLSRLTFFDRVVTDDAEAWEIIRHRFGLHERQRLPRRGRDPVQIAADAADLRRIVEAADSAFERPVRQIDRWALRTTRNKRRHIAQRDLLSDQLMATWGNLPGGAKPSVAHFGVGVGRFLNVYRDVEVTGLDLTPWIVDHARSDSPSGEFIVLGPARNSTLKPDRQDLVVATHLIAGEPIERRRALIREMWKITRVSGRIVVLDDFCTSDGMDTNSFIEEVVEETGGSAVLADVVGVAYGDGWVDDGLIAFSKIGTPSRW